MAEERPRAGGAATGMSSRRAARGAPCSSSLLDRSERELDNSAAIKVGVNSVAMHACGRSEEAGRKKEVKNKKSAAPFSFC